MDDMQVYIANLGKYNEGELVGAWFTFPIDFEEVKEKIGLNMLPQLRKSGKMSLQRSNTV